MFRVCMGLLAIFILPMYTPLAITEAEPTSMLVWKDSFDKFDFEIRYWDKEAKIIWQTVERKELFPDFLETGWPEKIAMTSAISRGSNEVYKIVLSTFVSSDPNFMFFNVAEGKPDEYIGSAAGTKLSIPGDGFLYTECRSNSKFNVTRKFKTVNNKITEVKQPFYFVGLKTRTLAKLDLLAEPESKEVVYEVQTGDTVEVLISTADQNHFLIRTEFGVIGWITESSDREATTLEGVFLRATKTLNLTSER